LTILAFFEMSIVGVHSWWINLSDRSHEGRWVWQHSVEDADFTYWSPGAPNATTGDQDCVIMNALEGFMWADKSCLHALASPICQKGEAGSRPTTSPSQPSAGPTEYPPDYVELRDGYDAASGTIFAVNQEGVFGPICRKYFSDDAAEVVCQQLGYANGWENGDYFDSEQMPIAFYNVLCTGDEERIQDCHHDTSGDCDNNGYAEAVCYN